MSNYKLLEWCDAQLLQMKIDTLYFRQIELEGKTEEQKNILLDRWSREDSAEKIADAIRSAGTINRTRFLGIF